MKFSRKSILAAAALLAVLVASPFAANAQKDVSGKWDLTVESPRGTTNPVLTLTNDGGKLSGTIKGQRGEIPVTGTISGSDIKISYTVKFQENELTITLSGTVSDDSMKGTADFGGMATGDWSGKRHSES